MAQEAATHPAAGTEVVDAVLVTEPRALAPRRSTGQLVKTQAAVVAGSFAAGAATAVVVAHRRTRTASRARRRRVKGGGAEIAASRSFLVDVHLLNRRP